MDIILFFHYSTLPHTSKSKQYYHGLVFQENPLFFTLWLKLYFELSVELSIQNCILMENRCCSWNCNKETEKQQALLRSKRWLGGQIRFRFPEYLTAAKHFFFVLCVWAFPLKFTKGLNWIRLPPSLWNNKIQLGWQGLFRNLLQKLSSETLALSSYKMSTFVLPPLPSSLFVLPWGG